MRELTCETCKGLGVVDDGFCVSRCPTCQPPALMAEGQPELVPGVIGEDDETTCAFCRLPLAPDEEGCCRECYPVEPCVECGEAVLKADRQQPCDACMTRMVNAIVAEMYAEQGLA